MLRSRIFRAVVDSRMAKVRDESFMSRKEQHESEGKDMLDDRKR